MNKKTTEVSPTEEDFDFGFSLVTEEELGTTNQQLLTSQDKLNVLYGMVMDLLTNLKKDPEKEIIKWPNRAAKIDEFIVKIKKIVNG